MTNQMYVVLLLAQDIDIEALGQVQKIPLQFADGMLGALPVFDSLAAASEYADGRGEIRAIQIKEGVR